MESAIVSRRAGSQSSIDPADWLPIEEAARLTSQTVRHWRRIAQASISRGLAYRASNGRTKMTWFVHRSLDKRLSRCPTNAIRDDRTESSLRAVHPAHLVDRALKRNEYLRQWRKLTARPRLAGETDLSLAERIVRQAKVAEGDAFKVSVRSLQAWWRAYNALGPDGQIQGLKALVPKYKAQSSSLPRCLDASLPSTRSPEAIEFFHLLYRTQSRHSVKLCHEMTLRESRKQGWLWPETIDSTRRWLREHDDVSLTFLYRWGQDKWARRYLSHLDLDYSLLNVGELFVCDHTQCDFWCTYKGEQIRPWLTAIEDGRSRVIVGWHLGPTPHQDAIVQAMHQAFRDWSIPEKMRIDNGRDFTSRVITGLTKSQVRQLRTALGEDWKRILQRDRSLVEVHCGADSRWLGVTGELGIELIYAIPYAPWSKGPIERWFGTFEDQCAKTFPTYCGASSLTKPECVEQIKRGYTDEQKRALRRKYGLRASRQHAVLKLVDQSAVPTLEQARSAIADYIDRYHRSAHSGDGMEGRAPLTVWQTATRLRKAVDDELLFLMHTRGPFKVGANGVRVTLDGARLAYGANCPALQPYVGREILVAIDPGDRSYVWAFTADGQKRKPIARLAANQRIHPCADSDDVRQAIAEQQRARRVMHQARRTAAARTKTAAELINKHHTETLAELRATGTEGRQQGNLQSVVPVSTGFEDVSTLDRSAFEPLRIKPIDADDFDDLFRPPSTAPPVDDDEDDIELMFKRNQPEAPEIDDDADIDLLFRKPPPATADDVDGGLEDWS